jgi:hypothetical protein
MHHKEEIEKLKREINSNVFLEETMKGAIDKDLMIEAIKELNMCDIVIEKDAELINQNEVGIVKYSFTKKCPSDRTWNVNGIIIDDDSIITTISDGITLTNEWSK